jgi:hypothetical protein
MLGWIREKMATLGLAEEVACFMLPIQPLLEMVP